VEEKNSPPYSEDAMTYSKEKMTNLEDTTPVATPHFVMNSNELGNPPMHYTKVYNEFQQTERPINALHQSLQRIPTN
jgi:hypothetical protein